MQQKRGDCARPQFKLVMVEWEDHAGSDGWCSLHDAQASNDDGMLCVSVGFLIAESKKRITIAASIGCPSPVKPEPDVAGQMTIARALIKKITTVRV
jgi:hypothetical protein